MKTAEYVAYFCEKWHYPEEAKAVLTDAYQRIASNRAALQRFHENAAQFWDSGFSDGNAVLSRLNEIAEQTCIHRYTVHLLFYLCLSQELWPVYQKAGLSEQIFYDSMADLKWKLMECHAMYGIWGSFVASWFREFFTCERFALGRLQFERVRFAHTYQRGCHAYDPDDIAINIHIPSSGPLHHAECEAAYRQAAGFFHDLPANKPKLFVCNSWLLFPPHEKMLPQASNIRRFMRDFDIIESHQDDRFGDLWRIFYQEYTGDPSLLPTNTGLQRAYVDWLMKGNTVGSGYGVMLL